MSPSGDFSSIPPAALAAVALLALVQVAMQVVALVQWAKTPAERTSIGGRKWIWLLIILLGELIGAIAWFVAGRTPAPADEGMASRGVVDDKSVIDSLYGEQEPSPKTEEPGDQ